MSSDEEQRLRSVEDRLGRIEVGFTNHQDLCEQLNGTFTNQLNELRVSCGRLREGIDKARMKSENDIKEVSKEVHTRVDAAFSKLGNLKTTMSEMKSAGLSWALGLAAFLLVTYGVSQWVITVFMGKT